MSHRRGRSALDAGSLERQKFPDRSARSRRGRRGISTFGASALVIGLMGAMASMSTSASAGVINEPHWVPPTVNAVVSASGAIDASCAPGLPQLKPFTTIQSAVDAASPGDTIYVCAGTYDEDVAIDEPLTLAGAQYSVAVGAGNDSVRTDPSVESVVNGSITYGAGATTGTLDGFTLQNPSSSTPVVVATAGSGTGWQWTDNIVDVSHGGMQLDAEAKQGTSTTPYVSRSNIGNNRFAQSSPNDGGTGGWAGQAVTFDGVANDVTVASNAFDYLTGPGAAINTTPFGTTSICASTSTDPTQTAFPQGSFSDALSVSGNTFVEDDAPAHVGTPGNGNEDNFLALFCTTNASVTGNTLTTTDTGDSDANSGIYVGGGDWDTTISGNTITGNGAPNTVGYQAQLGLLSRRNRSHDRCKYDFGLPLRHPRQWTADRICLVAQSNLRFTNCGHSHWFGRYRGHGDGQHAHADLVGPRSVRLHRSKRESRRHVIDRQHLVK